jgi:hypothetical protein
MVTDSAPAGHDETVLAPSSAPTNVRDNKTGLGPIFDLASTVYEGGHEAGSSLTVTSSGSGVTYNYPVPVTRSDHIVEDRSSDAPSSSAPPLPPRPAEQRNLETASVPAPLAAPAEIPPLPTRPAAEGETSHSLDTPMKREETGERLPCLLGLQSC